jgi:hypothetical protein
MVTIFWGQEEGMHKISADSSDTLLNMFLGNIMLQQEL